MELKFFIYLIVYFICFAISLYGLGAIDFERIMKKGRVLQMQILYLVIAAALAYMFGNFILSITYKTFVL